MGELKSLALRRLHEILKCKTIETQLSQLSNSNHWYKHTYLQFIKRFDETRGEKDMGLWLERVALVYSWLQKIPLTAFSLNTEELQKYINELSDLELMFYDAQLLTIGKSAYLGSKYHGEAIFLSYNGSYDISIREFLKPAGTILHRKSNLDTQLSSTTKLLHFMCPNLFPIFDSKVCKKIFEAKQSYARYHAYVFALQEFLEQQSEVSSYIVSIAQEMGVSPLYIIDYMVFNNKEVK